MAQRRTMELEDKIKDIQRHNDELIAENGKLSLQMDEMRSV